MKLRLLPRLLLLGLLLVLPQTMPASARAAAASATIQLSRNLAHPGDTVQILGTGFAQNEPVQIAFDAVPLVKASADGFGVLAPLTFTVPATATTGEHTIQAVGQQSGRTASTSLQVDSGVAPAPAAPADGTLIRDNSNGRVYLVWGGVRHWITAQNVLQALGYQESAVVRQTHAQVAALPEGPGLALRLIQNLPYPLSPISSGSPQLALSRPGGLAGGTLALRGAGFGKGEAVHIVVAGQTSTVTTDAAGAFETTVTVPLGIAAGTRLQLVAYGVSSGTLQVEPITLLSGKPAPHLGALSSSVAPGTPARVSGAGFQPGERIDLFLGNGLSAVAVYADRSGSFSVGRLSIPATLPSGQYVIFAVGTQSKQYAETTVTVAVPIHLAAATLTAPAGAHPGDQIRLSASGYQANELVQVYLNTVPVLTVRADAAGSFSQATLTVPANAAAGSYTIRATGESSGQSASRSLSITQVPQPLTLTNGELIRDVSNGRVYLMWAGVRHWLTTGTVFDNLGFNAAAIVDLARAVILTIPEGGGFSAHMVSGLLYPVSPVSGGSATITIRPPAGAPGAQVTVVGTGFGGSEAVQITLGAMSFSLPADGSGAVQTTVTIPPGSSIGSRLQLYAYGLTSKVLEVEPIVVVVPAPAPQISVAASSVAQGSTLQASGSGFAAGEKVNLFLASGESVASTTADASGAFSNVTVKVPSFLTAGTHTLFAAGVLSHQYVLINVTVTTPAPTPAVVTLSTSTASPGSLVLVSGSGFSAGEQVVVQFNGKPVLTVNADSGGKFSNIGFTVPTSTAAGTYPVLATGGSSKRQGVAGLTVIAYNPSLALVPTSGTPGAAITVTGQGFAPNEVVTLALNGAALSTTPSVITASASGTFTAGFTVPATALSGANTLTGNGVTSRASATATLNVTLPVQSSWYFAGGSTQGTDSTQIALANPSDQPAAVTFSFMFTSGTPVPYNTTVAPHSRATVDVGSIVGGGRTIFTMITADRTIGAEQTVYRSAQDFSSTIGTSAPLKSWYLAEGYTGLTFHEYIRIFNPNTVVANAVLRLLPFNGRAPISIPETVAPQSGLVIDVNTLAPRQSVAAIVDSDQPVVVDRLITFGPGGYGATEQMGSNNAASTWFFAEGSTLNNFETYLSVLNPSGSQVALVTATFFDQLGNVLGNTTIQVDPLRRGNIQVANFVRSSGIATTLTSNIPVFAERPLYFGSPNSTTAGSGGSDVFGRNGGGVNWLFPDGNTLGSYREFLLLQNPSLQSATVRVRFYTSTGQTVDYNLTVPARSRATIDVLKDVTALTPGLHSAVITSTNSIPIIAEQSIYADNFTKGDGVAGISQ